MSTLALARDVDVGALLLEVAGSKLSRGDQRIDQRVTGGTLERTMDAASTLTLVLDDSDRALVRSGVFDRQTDLELDGVWFRLVKVSKAVDALTLTFEDRVVTYLRQITKPRKAARSKMTRAEFALSIVREVKAGGGIPFVCPDLHVQQKVAIEKSTDKLSPAKRRADVGAGLSPAAHLTVKGATATKLQKQNAERVLDVADSLAAGDRATLALVQAVIVESQIQNLAGGDRDSRGILQVRDQTAAGMSIDNRDIEACCHAFLTRGFWGKGGAITIAAKNPQMSTGMVAQNTQGSGVPGAYDQWVAEARAFVAAYTGKPGGGTADTTQTRKLPFQFQRGGTDGTKEDSWSALQRLAEDVQWRCFVTDGSLYFVAETTLIVAKPRAVLTEDTLGVDGIDFDIDNGQHTSEATVTVRAGRHDFPPGSVVVLRDCGPANGRWLVATVSRGVFDAQATLTLKRATVPLPEPAAETADVTSSSGLTSLGAQTGKGGLAGRAYAAAQAIDAKHYPYVWGGGHAHCGTADYGVGPPAPGVGVGFDCTGAVCAVLAAAGMGFKLGGPAAYSGTIASSWGDEGPGQNMTVYACPDMPGQAGHAFIVFKSAGGLQHWGTGNWGKSWGGAGFNPQMHPTKNFTARHWPGT